MRTAKQYNIRAALAFLLVASLLFFCQGGSVNRLFASGGSEMDMSYHACCDIQEAEGAFVKHILFTVPPQQMSLVIFALFAFAVLRICAAWRENTPRAPTYAVLLDRSGGWRRLTPLLVLFQRGILHPKIY